MTRSLAALASWLCERRDGPAMCQFPRWAMLLGAALGVAAGVFLVLGMQGCAVGKSATGEAVVGVPIGAHPDADAIQALGVGVGSLFGPAGAAIGGTAAAALAGLLGWARSSGRHKGWEEREQAAAVQAPLGGGVDAVRPRVADAGAAKEGVVK